MALRASVSTQRRVALYGRLFQTVLSRVDRWRCKSASFGSNARFQRPKDERTASGLTWRGSKVYLVFFFSLPGFTLFLNNEYQNGYRVSFFGVPSFLFCFWCLFSFLRFWFPRLELVFRSWSPSITRPLPSFFLFFGVFFLAFLVVFCFYRVSCGASFVSPDLKAAGTVLRFDFHRTLAFFVFHFLLLISFRLSNIEPTKSKTHPTFQRLVCVWLQSNGSLFFLTKKKIK